jgi:hypothetical protein
MPQLALSRDRCIQTDTSGSGAQMTVTLVNAMIFAKKNGGKPALCRDGQVP